MHPIKHLIRKKRDGEALDGAEIHAFIDGVASNAVSEAHIAAFAMAVWFRGMDEDELTALTLAMRDSGTVLHWRDLDGPVLDKHSTGGVGDVVSLILGPVLAACGAYVPMISGRGLGHTGGTLDKLESIPGMHCSLDIERMQRQVRNHGIAIVGQSDELAPADRRIYAVRDVTATVSSLPLIVSSILSKKLAEGLDALVMDIKTGSGAVSTRPGEAHKLASVLCRVAAEAGLPCRALFTNMDQPLAESAGNALEVLEAVRLLRGERGNQRLRQVVLALSAEALEMSGLAKDGETARKLAESALETGRAAERFQRMVVAQGGPGDLLDRPDHVLPGSQVCRAVAPIRAGFVSAIDTQALGMIVVNLGGGRHRTEDRVHPAVGLSDICPLGAEVGGEAPLAVVHAADEAAWQRAADTLRSCVRVEPEPSDSPILIEKWSGCTE